MSGRKDDQGKPDYSLLPWDSVDEIIRVLQFGVQKYSRDNWQAVPDGLRRYSNAAMRHIVAL